MPFEQLPVHRQVAAALLARGRVGLRALALLLHQGAEAVLVDRQALFGSHLQGQVDREAVGVVQLEGPVPGQDLAAGALGLLGGEVEDPHPAGERGEECLLLHPHDLADPVEVAGDLRVGGRHGVPDHSGELGQHRLVHPEQAH